MKAAGPRAEFDTFAPHYDEALNQGLSLTGEGKEYFTRGRLHWLARRLNQLQVSPESILDFGCGVGDATPHFFDILGVRRVIGVDISVESIALARQRHGSAQADFAPPSDFTPEEVVDLVFTNGTFHHIPIENRLESLRWIHSVLRADGWIALWENNPWNPGTRWVMSRVPFDRDAQMLWPAQARRLLRHAGFQVVSTDFVFVFPRCLRWLRRFERRLCKLPLGGQYLILARKLRVGAGADRNGMTSEFCSSDQ